MNFDYIENWQSLSFGDFFFSWKFHDWVLKLYKAYRDEKYYHVSYMQKIYFSHRFHCKLWYTIFQNLGILDLQWIMFYCKFKNKAEILVNGP